MTPTPEFDVIGIGALNLDYLGSAQPARGAATSRVTALAKVLTELTPPLEWGTERTVTGEEMELALAEASDVQAVLGGSAFNVIHTLAATGLGLRLGYAGAAGRTPPGAPSFLHRFDQLGVDRSFVAQPPSVYSGICLSITEDGESTTLTHAGANAEVAGHIAANFGDLADYLASARVVHVTSFLDGVTPPQLARLLQALRKRNPHTLISVDPGFPWCLDAAPAVRQILADCDFLALNELELRELSRECPDDADAAAWVLRNIMAGKGTLLAKNPAGVRCYRMRDGQLTVGTYQHTPLPEADIVDATGAGDVFAAGFLAGVVLTTDDYEPGARSGMRMARAHLRRPGAGAFTQFPDLVRPLR